MKREYCFQAFRENIGTSYTTMARMGRLVCCGTSSINFNYEKSVHVCNTVTTKENVMVWRTTPG